VVENRGGAGGNIGMGHAARADADGYNLLLATNSVSVNVGLYNQLPYDIAKDFAAVCDVATSPNNFSVRSELPANSIKELVAMVKANPEKFNISSPPIGTTPQLQTALFKLRENLPGLANIIFTGGGEALQALLTGTSQISSGSLPPAAAHIKAGTLKALAVTGETRWPDLPDVPTMQEQGYKDFVFATDTALLAPSATPPDVMAKLETEARAVLARPEMKDRLFKAGFQVRGTDGKTCRARIAKEVTMFSDINTQAGIKKL
jgi:tripartite-type tricarboxylate transporter receptor subunit TctC